MKHRIIVALDVPTAKEATDIIFELPDCHTFKIGPHFLFDTDFDELVRTSGADIFIDLKFFDIPATVEAAISNLARRSEHFTFATVHAHPPIMEAAVKAAKNSQLKILSVALLTSFGRGDLEQYHNFYGDPTDFVVERVRRAVDVGCAGTICSAHDLKMLRGNVVPEDFLLIVPGTRSDKVATHDHKRVGSPAKAIKDGADFLVVGRQILQAESKPAMFNQIVDELVAA